MIYEIHWMYDILNPLDDKRKGVSFSNLHILFVKYKVPSFIQLADES